MIATQHARATDRFALKIAAILGVQLALAADTLVKLSFCSFTIFWAYRSLGTKHAVRTASATDQWFRLPGAFCLSHCATRVTVTHALLSVAAVV